MSNNKEIIVIVLVGIIVLMGVYIITNQNKPQKQVTFSVPEVSREIVFERDYDYGYLNTPTLFNPTGPSAPTFFQQMFFNPTGPQMTEPQTIGQTTNFQPIETSPRQEFRLMNLRSEPTQIMQPPSQVEGVSSVDILPHSNINE